MNHGRLRLIVLDTQKAGSSRYERDGWKRSQLKTKLTWLFHNLREDAGVLVRQSLTGSSGAIHTFDKDWPVLCHVLCWAHLRASARATISSPLDDFLIIEFDY